MNKQNFYRVIALVILFLMAIFGNCICGKKITEPVDDNPLDPDSPDYVAPVVSIDNIPDNFQNSLDYITINFSGNENVEDFRYLLEGRDTVWSPWGTATSVLYEYLDEGDYIFYLSGRSANVQVHDTVRFSIDKVSGPALMLSPKFLEVSAGQEFTLKVLAEEVTDLMLAEVVLVFDNTYFDVVSVDTGSFLACGGAEVVLIDSTLDSTTIINVGRTLADTLGVDGSGVLAKVTFKANAQATDLGINFSSADSSTLFSGTWDDKQKNIIPVNEMTGTIIHIQ